MSKRDTLVVDTIGFNTKTFVDVYRTPHSEKLHVVQRWRTVNAGKELEVTITVDDPDTLLPAPSHSRTVLSRAGAAWSSTPSPVSWRGRNLFEIACNYSPPDHNLTAVSERYGITIADPICQPGKVIPLP